MIRFCLLKGFFFNPFKGINWKRKNQRNGLYLMSTCFFLSFKILIIRNILRVLLCLSASSSFSGCKNDLDVIVCIIKQLEFAVRSSEPLSGGDVCEFFRQTAAEHRQTVIIRILQWVFFKIIFFLDLKKVALIAFEKRLSKNGQKSPSENLRQGFFLVNIESERFKTPTYNWRLCSGHICVTWKCSTS